MDIIWVNWWLNQNEIKTQISKCIVYNISGPLSGTHSQKIGKSNHFKIFGSKKKTETV